MSYKVKGVITKISEVETLSNGAKKLSFRIKTTEEYSQVLEFEVYKSGDYTDHADKFKDYNKVGDSVEVEFNLKGFNWVKDDKDKVFISLSCWKVEKIDGSSIESNFEEDDDLPF